MLRSLYLWTLAHPVETTVLLGTLVTILRAIYAAASRLVAPHPRARAVVEAIAALGPDVLRFMQQLGSAVAGRPMPTLDVRPPEDDLAALRREVARLRDALAAVEARRVQP